MARLHKVYMPHNDSFVDVDIDLLNTKDQAICIDMGLTTAHKHQLDALLKAMGSGPNPVYATYTRMPGTKPPP
jgi:hypothetical protein